MSNGWIHVAKFDCESDIPEYEYAEELHDSLEDGLRVVGIPTDGPIYIEEQSKSGEGYFRIAVVEPEDGHVAELIEEYEKLVNKDGYRTVYNYETSDYEIQKYHE